MTEWLGRGRLPRIQARSDRILHVLALSDRPLSTQEIARSSLTYYGHVYQDLRRLSGSSTSEGCRIPWDQPVTVPGYPVVWHRWHVREGDLVTWSLVPDYRTERHLELAFLESTWAASP